MAHVARARRRKTGGGEFGNDRGILNSTKMSARIRDGARASTSMQSSTSLAQSRGKRKRYSTSSSEGGAPSRKRAQRDEVLSQEAALVQKISSTNDAIEIVNIMKSQPTILCVQQEALTRLSTMHIPMDVETKFMEDKRHCTVIKVLCDHGEDEIVQEFGLDTLEKLVGDDLDRLSTIIKSVDDICLIKGGEYIEIGILLLQFLTGGTRIDVAALGTIVQDMVVKAMGHNVSDSDTQITGARMLGQLARESIDSRDAIVIANGHVAVIQAMNAHPGRPNLQIVCLMLLKTLASYKSEYRKGAILDAHGHTAIINAMVTFKKPASIRRHGAAALKRLAANCTFRSRLINSSVEAAGMSIA